MFECNVFHNGASDLPVVYAPDGHAISKGDLRAMHESNQRGLINQVRQGVLADRLGFAGFSLTEHHFIPEGAEFSPQPLTVEMAIAARTTKIRLFQLANIITQHDPVRLAESAALLDVLSGGRLEFGVGRGYQAREVETLGFRLGSSLGDDVRNRAYFEEALEVILKAWTEPSFSHHGQFFSIPPKHTIWHHPQTIAYFDEGEGGRPIDEILEFGPPTGAALPIQSHRTILKELSVFPQPLQKPHPQIWRVTNTRSSVYAAVRAGHNVATDGPTWWLTECVRHYNEAAEKMEYPDALQPGVAWKRGWDATRRRGVSPNVMIHIADSDIGDMDRAARAVEQQWHYYGAFGFSAILGESADTPPPLDALVTAQQLRDRGVALHGTPEYVTEQILKLRDTADYDDDFALTCWFELGGFEGAEIEEQMQCFAERVKPVLERECGGGVDLPAVGTADQLDALDSKVVGTPSP
jgi:alkanesulfonate monooxygenase SsuD/methylene tetrahydromethanopterin reductase-like flavin-dependent oxidoreductase (luciferase family)